MHGYGWIHDKPEFPDDWDEKKILDACIDMMKAKASAIASKPDGREDADLVVDGRQTDTSRDNMGYRLTTRKAHHVVLPIHRREVTWHVLNKGDGRAGASADAGIVRYHRAKQKR